MNRLTKIAIAGFAAAVSVTLVACSIGGGIGPDSQNTQSNVVTDPYSGPASTLVDCSSTTSAGADTASSIPVSFIQDFSGAAVSSVQFGFAVSFGLSGTRNITVSLDMYTCGDGSSLGTLAGSTTFSGTAVQFFNSSSFTNGTINFPAPVPVKNCPSGHRTVAFVFSNPTVSGGGTAADFMVSASNDGTCSLVESTNAANLSAGVKQYVTVITGYP